ncbi:MAG: formylglycine-generating enzyme family protein [Deltaproteobacteria bacterium]|jgi:formylglycine-generating enzyme required for sulfatase activity|nr:formylglycine-generating enzyme family protein [Deltaproteobacteria bacterium]
MKIPLVILFLSFFVLVLAKGGNAYTNSIGMEFVAIPPGVFVMGDLYGEDDEKPLRKITISTPFYLGKYEVTQSQWERLMGNNPSEFRGADRPVDSISWDMAMLFIQALNELEGTDKYRLPTEAEWEYAARGGTQTTYYFGNDSQDLGRYEWYQDNSLMETHSVGEKNANPFGIYDILGNVAEWVNDNYDEFYYAEDRELKDPTGPDYGEEKVIRGGSRHDEAYHCRPADRLANPPDDVYSTVRGSYGFRVAFTEKKTKMRLSQVKNQGGP